MPICDLHRLIYIFKIEQEKLPLIQINKISFISQFSTHIQYIEEAENTVANAFLRKAITENCSTILNFDRPSSMIIEEITIPGSDIQIYCDTSTGKNRSYVTLTHHKQVLLI